MMVLPFSLAFLASRVAAVALRTGGCIFCFSFSFVFFLLLLGRMDDSFAAACIIGKRFHGKAISGLENNYKLSSLVVQSIGKMC